MEAASRAPAAAREAIEAWSEVDLHADLRAVLNRLATCNEATQEVWSRLPADRAGPVITLALLAYAAVMDVRMQVLTKAKVKSEAADLAANALRLANSLATDMVFEQRISSSGVPITLAQFIELLRDTARYFDGLDAEARDFVRSLRLPRISRKRSIPDAPQIHFARVMGRGMRQLFGTPKDAAIAALTNVVFDRVNNPIDIEAVKQWRRAR
jgi:hypothetical protein